MKKITIVMLCLFSFLKAQAQHDTDRIKGNYSIMFGVLPIKISGTTNTGSNQNPAYKRTDTTGVMGNFGIQLGLNLPFYRAENWSIGAKINAGVGRLGSLRAAEGLDSYILDFPEFVYYRNYATSIDFSVLAGIKHTRAALDYTLPMAGLGFNGESASFLFYGSLKRYTYYSLYSNGEIKPAVKIGEFGLMLTFDLGGD